VEQGFYSSRSGLIRTAIRNQLGAHAEAIQQTVVRKDLALGVLSYNRAALEAKRTAGEKIEVHAVGVMHPASDVTPELARDTIQSLKVYGVLGASPALKDALADRVQ
jgi:Arc/MetJ-type ribon-helix-helix transcriptional regulator